MSYTQKNAALSIIIWTMVLGGLITLVLGPGVRQFTADDHRGWRLIAAVILLLGFLLNGWLGWKSKQGYQMGELDERDSDNARRASEATLIVVTSIIFLISILLYETYRDSGLVPIGWLYLIAYGTVALVSLVHAISRIVVDCIGEDNG